MRTSDIGRRTFLAGLGVLGVSQMMTSSASGAPAAGAGFVLGPSEGEHLIHFRDGGDIFIKVGAESGSQSLAWGTQQVKQGTGIPTHRHLKMDESFLVMKGSGSVLLNDVRHPFEEGATIFIPKSMWHGFENPDHELLVMWIVAPSGLDGFFRETCSAPGAAKKGLTRDQIREIARKYDTEFR